MSATAAQDLQGFLKRYDPEIAARAKAALATMRKAVPGAVELVYDNYNALVVGFGPSERASEAVFSIVLYPRWVTLFFLKGATLPDPRRLLKGSGKRVRHIVLEDATVLSRPGVRRLIAAALKAAPWPAGRGRRVVVKSISAKQRPRRPARRAASSRA
jgi:hypothetical protein